MMIFFGVILFLVSPEVTWMSKDFSENVTDSYGNHANNASQITWAAIPPGATYETDPKYDPGGLGPLYSIAVTFINIVQPKAFPFEMVSDIQQGNFNTSKRMSEITFYLLGFIILTLLGVLFAVIVPTAGLFFCSCRLCGKCGGKMHQLPHNASNRCKCMGYGIALLVLTGFMVVGVICSFATNERLSDSVHSMEVTVDSNLADIAKFVTNTVTEVSFLILTNFKFSSQVIKRDLEGRHHLIGVPLLKELSKQNNIPGLFNQLQYLQEDISRLDNSLHNIHNKTSVVEAEGLTLTLALALIKDDLLQTQNMSGCNTSCDQLDPSLLSMNANYSSLPDVRTNINISAIVKGRNLVKMVEKGEMDFNNIPNIVKDQTEKNVNDLYRDLNEYAQFINTQLKEIKALPQIVSMEVDKLKAKISIQLEILKYVDGMRWCIFLALTCVILLIALLQLIGNLFGAVSYDSTTDPIERGCLGNTGGNMLMAATGLIVLFSPVLMTLTTLTLDLGGNMEKLGCQPLTDPDYTLIKLVLDNPNGFLVTNGDYTMGQIIYGDGSIPLTVSGVLDGCKKNQPAYQVLGMEHVLKLKEVTDYKKTITPSSHLDDITINLSNVTLLSKELEMHLLDFQRAISMNYKSFKNELSKAITTTDLKQYSQSIRKAAQDGTNENPAKQSLLDVAKNLDTLHDNLVVKIQQEKGDFLQDVTKMEEDATLVHSHVDRLINNTKLAQYMLPRQARPLVTDLFQEMIQRIITTTETYASRAVNGVQNEIARCRPVWNVWESLIHENVCGYTVDSVNGLWLSWGWCILMMIPCAIINVKLAKYYRRMLHKVSPLQFEGSPVKDPVPLNSVSNQIEKSGSEHEHYHSSSGFSRIGLNHHSITLHMHSRSLNNKICPAEVSI